MAAAMNVHRPSAAATELRHVSFHAMAADNELQFYWPRRREARGVAEIIIAEVRRIEAKYSRYREDSVITRINRNAGIGAVPVDEETAALLNYADACHKQSDGLFDITSGVLRRAWDFRRAVLPSAEQIASLLPLICWQRVEWTNAEVRLPAAGMELDFGGIGKEYAADRAAAVALQAGVAHGFVNLAGDVRVIGPHPDGSPWTIGIVHPRRPGQVIARVAIQAGGLATSGDYERYFEVEGRRYCHILNPRTGYPVNGLQSVSVAAPLCTVAGSLSSIAMLKEAEGCAFLDAQGFPSLRVDASGNLSGRAMRMV
jgi:thiamine biosynthesis lipoprotein